MNIAIAGYGVEGKVSFEYWSRLGNIVTIVDERSELSDTPRGALTILGPNAFSQLGSYDLVVRAPSVRLDKLPYGDRVWSATNEFFSQCPAPIIGVTGTKGKGTTASLITSILRAAGKTVYLVGNIGTPALSVLSKLQKSDIIVYELSSFQLWDLRASPHIAVVLGIEPDHLDVHANFEEYVSAKANITRHQTPNDTVVYNVTNEWSRSIANQSAGRRVPYPFDISAVKDSLRIPGQHNVDNASAAIASVREYTTDEAIIEQGLSSFTGLPHRLKFIAERKGVTFYDDSIATTPGSAIAAMHSFDAPKLLILGGSDKGADYHGVVAVAKETGTRVLAIGRTGAVIWQLCDAMGVEVHREEGMMPAVVARAMTLAQPGSVVILSPASASFDQYNSYSDRGNQFITAVTAL